MNVSGFAPSPAALDAAAVVCWLAGFALLAKVVWRLRPPTVVSVVRRG